MTDRRTQSADHRQKIDAKQVKKIKTLQTALKMSDDEYRLLLSDYFVNSCTDLSYDEAEEFIATKLKPLAVQVGVWKEFHGARATGHGPRRYESSLDGLKEEICDIAKARWGAHWEQSLNKLIANPRFGVDRWQFLNVTVGLKVKKALLAMQAQGPYVRKRTAR